MQAAEPDVIVVGAGLAGLVATHELAKAGRRVLRARPGEPRQPRRPGVLVARRAVLRRQPRAAPDGHQGLLRARAAGLAGLRQFDREREDHWPRQWARGVRRLRAAREARTTCTTSGCGSCRSSAGPSAATAAPRGHGNSVPALPPHLGHRPRGRAGVRRAGARGRGARAGALRASATRSTSSSSRTARPSACAARCSRRATTSTAA